MFPSVVFRKAYDTIQTPYHGTKGDLEYLRILHLAASTMAAEVQAARELLLAAGGPVSSDAVKAMIATTSTREVPELQPSTPELADYDDLLVDRALEVRA